MPDSQPITARLAAASSRRWELETLLNAAQGAISTDHLRRLILEANVAGKASAVSRQKLWWQLRERYLLDPAVPECAAFLAGMAATSSATDRGLLCLLMAARTDRLSREVTLVSVSPYLTRDNVPIPADRVQRELCAYLEGHGLAWSPDTTEHVRQHLLAALKDLGVLRGSRGKRTIRQHPGSQVTLLVSRFALLEGLTPWQALESRWFRLLGLDREEAVDLLYAAAREGALRFQMQAQVVELQIPDTELCNR